MIQKKAFLFSCLLISIVVFFFIGCFKKNENILNEYHLNVILKTDQAYIVEFKIDDNMFYYSSENKNSVMKSSFKIFREKSIIYESQYELDTSINDYRLFQHKKVEQIAKSLRFELQEQDYKTISAAAQSFIETIFNSSGIRKKQVQSIFYHLAIINTKMRSFGRNASTYECLPHPGYILGRAYFWCQEDYYVKVNLIKNIYKIHPELIKDNKNQKFLSYINSVKNDSLAFDKIYSFFIDKQDYLKSLDNIVARNNSLSSATAVSASELDNGCAWWCPLGCGTDRGCCGNYSGCCYYTSLLCYIHDAVCTNCTPRWFCFSGCVPD